MNILTAGQFNNVLLPVLPEKYHMSATLQRFSGLRAFETRLKRKGPLAHPISWGNDTIRFAGKKGKIREVPLPLSIISLEEIKAHYRSNHVPSYNSYYKAMKKAMEEIGHEPWTPNKKHNVTHCLRAYFICDWITTFGTTIENLQELIGITGHSSLQTIQPYLNALGQEQGRERYRTEYQKIIGGN